MTTVAKLGLRRCLLALIAAAICTGSGGGAAYAATLLPSARSGQTILIVGDSISAGYGLPRDSGWVNLLIERLGAERFDYSVVNASISGETTSGGRTRLPDLLKTVRPAVVIVQLGANDGLRGLPIAASEKNLGDMIEASLASRARTLLVGMKLPPNYGKAYTEQFAGMYLELAKRYKIAVVPFLFEGFAYRIGAFQPDRIHPTVETQPLLLDNVWPKLKPLLSK